MGLKDFLLIIDMQEDFVTGALANKAAEEIVSSLRERATSYKEAGKKILFTRDTHDDGYLETQEGRKIPVVHCVKDSKGWNIVPQLQEFVDYTNAYDKPAFGDLGLPKWIVENIGYTPKSVEVCGVCTDICVISCVTILRAAFPNCEIFVRGDLCAGVTKDSHDTALKAMAACQINIEE